MNEDFPQIVPGWPAEEIGASFDDYIEHWKDVLDDLTGDDDPPVIPPYIQWRDEMIDAHDGYNEFSFAPCDHCGTHLGGPRYEATALPENPAENKDYIALEICSDCYEKLFT